MEVPFIWESKTKLLKRVFFSVLRRKTLKRMQTNQYKEIDEHYQKGIFWVFLSLLATKKEKMNAKHSILGNKGTLRETCIMSVLLFSGKRTCGSQESQGKKRKNLCIWRSFLDTKMLKVMNNTLNWETEQHYQMRVFWVFFTFLVTKTPNCMQN